MKRIPSALPKRLGLHRSQVGRTSAWALLALLLAFGCDSHPNVVVVGDIPDGGRTTGDQRGELAAPDRTATDVPADSGDGPGPLPDDKTEQAGDMIDADAMDGAAAGDVLDMAGGDHEVLQPDQSTDVLSPDGGLPETAGEGGAGESVVEDAQAPDQGMPETGYPSDLAPEGLLADALEAAVAEAGDLAAQGDGQVQALCGDGLCQVDSGEGCESCPKDCGPCPPVCGNAVCEAAPPAETAKGCPADCGSCGDGVCALVESKETCPADCAPACGNGACEEGEVGAGEELPGFCPTDCGGCDDGYCGYQDFELGCQAKDCAVGCGDGLCDDSESAFQCPHDCGKPCGDGLCEPGESLTGCPVDCGYCGDGICGQWGPDPESCPQDCLVPCGDGVCWWGETAKTCAADCGPCGDGICSVPEQKQASCQPDCAGCGNGVCEAGETIKSCPADCGGCIPFCAPGWTCGEAGCGQSCGLCPAGKVCVDHACCQPDCEGKQCGDDGCGGECALCGPSETCIDFLCTCSDDGGKEPNDGCLQATALEPGTYPGLAVCTGGDEDWYAVEVKAGLALKVKLAFKNADGDLDLFLYKEGNCSGYVLASTSSQDGESLTYTTPNDATLRIRVKAGGPVVGNSYDLSVEVGPPACNDGECQAGESCTTCPADCGECCVGCKPWEACIAEQCICQDDGGNEPDDLCTQAVKLAPGLYAGLAICSGGDEDWYLVHAEAGETLQAVLTFDHGMGNLNMYLFSSGNCVGWIAKSTSLTDVETITQASPAKSDYYLQVKGFGPAVGATYTLAVAAYPPGCGNGVCAAGESCAACPLDCKCGCGESCLAGVCTFSACQGKQCGPDGCGGACGQCDPQHICQEGICLCVPAECEVLGHTCGTWDDGCGGQVVCGPDCPEGPLPVDLFLVVGQSNARGMGKGAGAAVILPGTAFEFDPSGPALEDLKYPTGLPAGNTWTSNQTSFVVAFGKRWYELSGRIPVFVCRAKGGTSLLESADAGNGDWTDVVDADGLFDTAVLAAQSCVNFLKDSPDYKVEHRYLLWHQGESDGLAGIGWGDYRAALIALFQEFDAEIGFDAFFVSEIGHRLPHSAANEAQFLEIMKGQQQAQEAMDKAVLVSQMPRQFTTPCFDNLADPACALYDNYHYETWAYEALGKDMASNAWTWIVTAQKPLEPDL